MAEDPLETAITCDSVSQKDISIAASLWSPDPLQERRAARSAPGGRQGAAQRNRQERSFYQDRTVAAGRCYAMAPQTDFPMIYATKPQN